MHPTVHARLTPEKAACVMASTGETLNYHDLDARSNQGAHLFRDLGLRRGDMAVAFLDNGFDVFTVGWAAQRAGLYLTSGSTRLGASDIAHILADSDAKVVICSAAMQASMTDAVALGGFTDLRLFVASDSERGWARTIAGQPITPISDESPGSDMLYSSGTTGRPKGVKPPLPEGDITAPPPILAMAQRLYGMDVDTLYLSTSPLYHAAPLRWAMTVQRLGGTVVVMEEFDAEATLACIQRYRVTHGTFVPTHFVRILKLPEPVRAAYDHASLKTVIHAAAPCPVPIKQAMIDWWGPIIHEYYSGTETCGITALSSDEWLRKPGSVGRAVVGTLRILDEAGHELPVGETGYVYFADGPRFEYHNDPDKTRAAYSPEGWATMGDIGRIDADGYLYLTDRKDFTVISGGVNIYPQEIENLLITHPKVAEVAVFGLPDEEMGEKVIAVVQPAAGVMPDPALGEELLLFIRKALGGVKCPRIFAFHAELPRTRTGKLLKKSLRDEYLAGRIEDELVRYDARRA